jgi:hypothetical protein
VITAQPNERFGIRAQIVRIVSSVMHSVQGVIGIAFLFVGCLILHLYCAQTPHRVPYVHVVRARN